MQYFSTNPKLHELPVYDEYWTRVLDNKLVYILRMECRIISMLDFIRNKTPYTNSTPTYFQISFTNIAAYVNIFLALVKKYLPAASIYPLTIDV